MVFLSDLGLLHYLPPSHGNDNMLIEIPENLEYVSNAVRNIQECERTCYREHP
jgi:hypothetical protein